LCGSEEHTGYKKMLMMMCVGEVAVRKDECEELLKILIARTGGA
jgi:hypothetical protein